jgi:hypothetical protein
MCFPELIPDTAITVHSLPDDRRLHRARLIQCENDSYLVHLVDSGRYISVQRFQIRLGWLASMTSHNYIVKDPKP